MPRKPVRQSGKPQGQKGRPRQDRSRAEHSSRQRIPLAVARRCCAALAAPVILVSVGVLVYANSFDAPFVMDSYKAITENSSTQQIWPSPTSPGANRPLGFVTFALNYALAERFNPLHDGYAVWGYHAVNLTIHLAAALVLFGIVRRTLARSRPTRSCADRAWFLALAAAVVWMVHPLQTECVTYVYQRIESLAGLFYLLTLYGFIRGRQSRGLGVAWAWGVVSIASCALAMGTKEVAATAPVMVLWYDLAFTARYRLRRLRTRWAYYAGLAATWTVPAYLMLSHLDKYQAGSALLAKNVTPLAYARTQSGVIMHYLRLSFWPQGLCFDYDWPVATVAQSIMPSLAIAALLAATTWCVVRRPAWGFLGGWFFVLLAPTSSFVPLVDRAFEHRMYLPLAAVVVAAVLAADAALRAIAARSATAGGGRFNGRLVACSALGLVAGMLGWLTVQRNEVYRSAIGIYEDTIAKSPLNPRPHFCLSREYFQRRMWDDAVREASIAIQLKPDYAEPYNNRANAYFELGQFDKAMADYSRFLELRTDVPVVYHNRGTLYQKLGRYDEAIADYTKSVEISPLFAHSYMNRAQCHGALEQWQPMIADITKVIQLLPDKSPDKILAYHQRAIAYCRAGKYDAAWADIGKVRQLGGMPDPVFLQQLGDLSGQRE